MLNTLRLFTCIFLYLLLWVLSLGEWVYVWYCYGLDLQCPQSLMCPQCLIILGNDWIHEASDFISGLI